MAPTAIDTDMPTIGIVDDETRSRKLDVDALNLNLPKGWKAIGTAPFEHLGDYPSWIAENNVAVLLLDQELGRQSSSPTGHVRYKGHNVVKTLRARNKTLPIYFLTNYGDQAAVEEQIPAVEGIFDKKLFRRRRADFIKRMTRRGKDYFKSVKDQLAELNDLSVKIAKGEATAQERRNAKALQTNLELPLLTESFNTRSEWLAEYEQKVEQLDKLQKEVQRYLNPQQRRIAKKK